MTRRYGISTGLLYTWPKQLLTAATDGFIGCEVALPAGTRVYLACGRTDMRRGFYGLAAQVQTVLARDPHDGALFVFRGKRGDLVKAIWWTAKACACSPAPRARPLPVAGDEGGLGLTVGG